MNISNRAGLPGRVMRAGDLLAVVLASLVASLGMAGCQADNILQTESGMDDRVHVSGSASVQVTPNVATATMGVQTFDADAVVAVTSNNERSAAVLNTLEGLGVDRKDLQTSNFSISPQRAFSEDRPDSIVGFWVRNTISATIRDLTVVGTVLQDAIGAGANEIHGLQFTVSNPDSVEDVARALAVVDARRRARALAEAAEAKLGRIISLSESSVSTPSYFRNADATDGAVPIEPGQLEASAVVTAVFELK